MKQSHHVDIQTTPDRVFYWLDDAERVMQWIDGVVENEDLEVKEGHVGSTFRQVFDENGRKMEFHGVVTDYEQDRRLGVSLVGQFFDLDVDYVLEPQGSSSRVTQNSSVRYKGLWKVMGPLMAPFMKKAGQKKLDEDFARLKALCENG